jgi:hypothetical protein
MKTWKVVKHTILILCICYKSDARNRDGHHGIDEPEFDLFQKLEIFIDPCLMFQIISQ